MAETASQQYETDRHQEHGVLPALAAQMKVDFLVNRQGRVTILHDQKLPGMLEWLEFDRETGQFTLLYKDGRTQLLGLDLPDQLCKSETLKNGPAFLIYIENGLKKDMEMAPLMVRQPTFA